MTTPYLSKLSLSPAMSHLGNHPNGQNFPIQSSQGPTEWNVFLASTSISPGLQSSICLANHPPTPAPPCQISCWGLHLRVKQLNWN